MKTVLLRRLFVLAAGALTLSLSACTRDGHFTILGYSTEPVYDPSIRTVYVPICQNVSFRRGIEFDLTRAIIREIEANSPFKVVSCRERADTELLCKIVNWRKSVILGNQLNETRDAEVGIACELTWRDLRPGTFGYLSAPLPPPGAPLPAPDAKPPPPILVEPAADYVPELGSSRATAEQMVINRLARGIVYKMEWARPW